jgi:hypothetical protein
MPIQIIDNFELNSPKPLDNRLVVGSQSFYTNKDDIPYKYAGMRIWDLDAGIPYYWTGSTYSSENTSTISGPGTSGYIPKYIQASVVGNSLLYDDGISSIGVGTNNPFSAVPGLFGLDVNGRIRSSTGFMGSGQFLQSINASNITLGSLSLARLTNGISGQVLVAGVSQPQWTNANQITVGTSSAVSITNDTASATTHYLTFATTTSGSSVVKVSSSKLQFVPSTGNFYVSGNVGLGTSPSTEKLKVQGVVSITGNTTIVGVARITRSGVGAFDLGYQNGSTNFDIEANSTSTQLKIYNPTSPATYFTTITQFSNYTFIGGNGQTYLNVNNEGNRLIAFGRVGLNDQMVLYMDNSPLNVSTVGGKGVYVVNNLRVDGKISVGNVSGSGVALYRNASDGSLTVTSSDIRLKENISYIENSIDIVKQLRGVFFNWKDNVGFDTNERQIGMIAQEVEDVFPEAVVLNGVEDYKTIKYSEMAGLLINAIKEQQLMIDGLTKRIEDLES